MQQPNIFKFIRHNAFISTVTFWQKPEILLSTTFFSEVTRKAKVKENTIKTFGHSVMCQDQVTLTAVQS